MPRRVGAYAKLLSNYASDDAIIAAGEEAELLFVRGLAFCSTSDSDGYITEAQVYRFVAAGMKRVPQRISALVREGVWVAADGGYVVRNWTKVHETAEEKGRKRKTDRERKRRDIPSGVHAESDRTPDGATLDSLLCSYVSSKGGTEQSTTGQGSDSETGVDSPPPSPFCSKHPNGTDDNCRACGTARKRYDQWVRDEPSRRDAARSRVQNCKRCHGGIWLDDGTKCDHRRTA